MEVRRQPAACVLRLAIALALAAPGISGALAVPAAAASASPPAAASASGAAPPPAPRLAARAAAVVEAESGTVLLASDPDRELPIASTTKIMTAVVVLEHAPLGRVLPAPAYAAGPSESTIGLRPGERMTVHDLLIALLLPSANDAAHDLAVGIGHGSVRRFIGLMNAQARALGLRHTHYATPVGLDTPGNYSSARDLTTLARWALGHSPFFARVVALHRATIHSGAFPRVVVNRNTLLDAAPWVSGVKTGYTRDAGDVLVASGTRDGMTLVSAVLEAPSESARDAASLAALEYGFRAFAPLTVVRAGAPVARAPVVDQPGLRAELVAGRSLRVVVARGSRLSRRIELRRALAGPLPRGAVLGHLVVRSGRRVVGTVPLRLAQAVPAVGALHEVIAAVLQPLVLLPLLLAAGAGAVLIRRRAHLRRLREREDDRRRRWAQRLGEAP